MSEENGNLRAELDRLTREKGALHAENEDILAGRERLRGERDAAKESCEGAFRGAETVRGERDSALAEVEKLRKESKEFAGMNRGVGISDRCPACGGKSLFVGNGGWLTCSRIECEEPGVGRAIKSTYNERDALRARVEELEGLLQEALDSDPIHDHWLHTSIQAGVQEYSVGTHGGLSLTDVLSAPHDSSILTGEVEVEILIDSLWGTITDALKVRVALDKKEKTDDV